MVDLDGVPISPAAGHESDGLLALLRCENSLILSTHYEIWNLGCLELWFQRSHRGVNSELDISLKYEFVSADNRPQLCNLGSSISLVILRIEFIFTERLLSGC